MSEEVEDLFGDGNYREGYINTLTGKLSRFIKKQFGYPSKVVPKGVGGAIIYVGEK